VEHVERKWKKGIAYELLMRKPEGWRPIGKLRHRWWIILRCIFQRYDGVVWTGLVWLRMGTSGELL
jgi:hypothetical protein